MGPEQTANEQKIISEEVVFIINQLYYTGDAEGAFSRQVSYNSCCAAQFLLGNSFCNKTAATASGVATM